MLRPIMVDNAERDTITELNVYPIHLIKAFIVSRTHFYLDTLRVDRTMKSQYFRSRLIRIEAIFETRRNILLIYESGDANETERVRAPVAALIVQDKIET